MFWTKGPGSDRPLNRPLWSWHKGGIFTSILTDLTLMTPRTISDPSGSLRNPIELLQAAEVAFGRARCAADLLDQ